MDVYDETKKYCSGVFEFSVFPDSMKFSRGTFTVPLFG